MVALRQARAALLTIVSTGLGADLQLHQPFGSKADHLAKQVGIGALLYQRTQVHHGFGHRGHPSVQVGVSKPTLPRNPMATESYTTTWDLTPTIHATSPARMSYAK